ncbi:MULTISPECIES: DUF397 domain-containing protein [Streptomyces]|uniref:DUF397 domain-containing protein n=1 Tax=Streptomyces sviceus (strain ATCC 29083 / DSM 924 / JCM 4929 / NBRC 13980 / NCIMB 11184 / NRRL 5439 / UC 5370) TaxID=463191 RepID=B5HZP8_STRX2|nr:MULTISPECIES: DUF397 domain-containing protein [Streptomyces]EDY58303.1 conserved hypothetical protein [Streptomyces sviceus ATCC 29083]MYT08138.1 DUF397 domain-containing protein [Streptomyces sp. SID5470]
MTTPDQWKKSSYSGGGEGNDCVEIAARPTHISIRDSKAPTRATLTVPTGAFSPFIEALKTDSARTEFTSF